MLAAAPFNILSNLDQVDDAIDANADIASEILETALRSFGLKHNPTDPSLEWHGSATPSDMDKARTTIRQLYRDWSAEGAEERRTCYGPVLTDLSHEFKSVRDKATVKVLLPGAGLGRLAFEFCKLGYAVEGNEISCHQLLASSWILNDTQRAEQFDLYPFALAFSNHVTRDDQLKVVKVPDVHPKSEMENVSKEMQIHAFERMSMTAADFVILYGDEVHKDIFDAVVTVFFIDTARNVLQYIEVARNCLKDGGVWINLGPLLWHFAEQGYTKDRDGKAEAPRKHIGIEEAGSVELTDEEVLMLIERMGFDVEKHEIKSQESGYIQNPESMLQNLYRMSHWVARKV
ncbi:hypothetical protein MMC12_007914 [Toensbergia leucococca]|nr:hypothetical protein [Toensbergia leucococca]